VKREERLDLNPAVKTEREQEEIASDVAYEWEMLSWTFQTICRRIGKEVVSEADSPFPAVWYCGTSRDTQEASAMLEPFLLHVRNIRDFLYCNSLQKDDVLAVHFFVKPNDWIAVRPPLGNYLESLRERINKSLAHLSYARLKYRSDEGWNIERIKNELDKPWRAFIDVLSPEKRQWFRSWAY
jgi:hypothetical protein